LKDSIDGGNGPKKKTSRTDEDIADLAAEISQDGPRYNDFSTKYRRISSSVLLVFFFGPLPPSIESFNCLAALLDICRGSLLRLM
jgi:hypothetical protein